jgi:hypothetical protein
MPGIFLPGQKRLFSCQFSPFFSHVTPVMLLQKRKNWQENPSFLTPATPPRHARKVWRNQVNDKSPDESHPLRKIPVLIYEFGI